MPQGEGPNTQIHTIGFDTMRSYKNVLMEKPKKGKPLSQSSIDKYLGVPKAIFNWAIRNNYITVNPADGLQLGKRVNKRRADEERQPFEIEDLRKLFLS